MSDLLEAGAVLGRRICRDAVWHRGACGWLGVQPEEGMPDDGTIVCVALGRSLYSGTSGVALFLAELWSATEEADFRRTALGAMSQALAMPEDDRARVPSLYAGRVGIALVAARAAGQLGEPELAERAARLIADDFAPPERPDLVGGRAGTLLGLLCLRGLVDDPRYLERADLIGRELAATAEQADGTLSWPVAERRYAFATGLAHGAAGVVLAFLELYRATGAAEHLAVAEGALAYERRLFEPEEGNWPHSLPAEEAIDGRRSFLSHWCHGAPGIALSRLRAWEITGDERCRDEARIALSTTERTIQAWRRTEDANYSLCHGLAGNAEVLAEGEAVLGSEVPGGSVLAVEVAEEGIARHEARGLPWPCGGGGETPSLMLGLAGIGLFLLRLADATVPSVLLPRPEAWLGRGEPIRSPPDRPREARGAGSERPGG